MAYATPIGFQATLSVNDGSGASQQAFTHLVTISVPFGDVSALDTWNMASSSRNATKLPGKVDPGEASFEQFYNAADYNRLVALRAAMKTWNVTAPSDGTTGGTVTWSFDGFLSKCELSMETENLIKVKGTITVSGDIDVTTA
jgi:hypothetical protein